MTYIPTFAPFFTKDNLFPHKIPEVMREMIDVLVVIKIPD